MSFLFQNYLNPMYTVLQTVKNQMKCQTMWHFIRIHTVKVKKIIRQKIHFFQNYNLTPLDMCNGLSQVYCIKSEGESICI